MLWSPSQACQTSTWLVVKNADFLSPFQMIMSPQFPSNYPPNINCHWVISSPRREHVHLKFLDFNLESSAQCTKDSLSIKDLSRRDSVRNHPNASMIVSSDRISGSSRFYAVTLLHTHTILKVKFLSKNSILTKTQHFHEFFTQIFFDNFSREIKVTAKKPKATTFSRVFHPKKIDNFLGKSKLIFWTKNEDFEQCDVESRQTREKKEVVDPFSVFPWILTNSFFALSFSH